jgi:ATP-dependent Clp protease ATP-binding subunit ClpB
MDFEKLTNKSKEVIETVVKLATANKNQYITPLHLLKVLLDGKYELILNLISKSGGDISSIREKMDSIFAKLPQVAGSSVQTLMSQDFTSVIMEAEKLADKSNDKFVTIERLLQALSTYAGTDAYNILQSSGVNAVTLNQAINDYRNGRLADTESSDKEKINTETNKQIAFFIIHLIFFRSS